MKLKIIVTTAVLIAVGLAVAVEARSSAHTVGMLKNKQCQKCDVTGAKVKDARQERQEQRQQQQNAQPTLQPDARQQRQEQRQQQQNTQPTLQPDARQQRQEQRQQQQNAQPTLQPDARQQRQEQRQQRQQQQNTQPTLQPDARQQRQEQRQQHQQQQNTQPTLQPDARQQRQEQRQQRQDTRQERLDQRQDTRRDRIREQDAWWLRDNQTWWLQDNQTWWHQYGDKVYPVQTVRSIKVHFISLTQDRVKVLIEGVNGRQEIVFEGRQTRQTVYLAPGTHKLWFKDTRDSPWSSGTLNLGRTNLIRVAFHKGKRLVQACDDHYAWIEDRYFQTESLQLNRTPIECPAIADKSYRHSSA